MTRTKKLKEYVSLLLSSRKRTAAARPADTGLPDENDGTPAAGGDPDPLRLLSQEFLAQIDDLARSFQQNEPCPHASINSFPAPDFCEQLVREFPDCDADVLERSRANNLRGGKSKKQNIKELGGAFLAFDEPIKSEEALEILSKITGIPGLIYGPEHYGGGTHESLNGERLLPHIDYNYHPSTGYYRRLNLLVCLNPEWQREWGGELELHSDPQHADNDRMASCPINRNNCAILATTSTSRHGFPVIELPADKHHLSRRSIAVYYYTESPHPMMPTWIDQPSTSANHSPPCSRPALSSQKAI